MPSVEVKKRQQNKSTGGVAASYRRLMQQLLHYRYVPVRCYGLYKKYNLFIEQVYKISK
jgi:hypothetical protein